MQRSGKGVPARFPFPRSLVPFPPADRGRSAAKANGDLKLSCDLMMFDSVAAPMDREAIVAWNTSIELGLNVPRQKCDRGSKRY